MSSTVQTDATIEPDLDVAACVERVRQGDEDAARRLVGYLYPHVIRLVRSHLPRRSTEEDMAQIVFMRIFSKLDQFSGAVPLKHWVSRIAVNACLNHIEAERIRPELRWADLSEEQCQALERITASGQELRQDDDLAAREIVEQLLSRLDPAERMLLSLLHLDGHTPREVAKITGWSSTIIRVRAFRARRKLKKHLSKLLAEKEHEHH